MNQPMMELPSYKSHKIVRALSIAAIEVHEDRSATIAPSLTAYAPFKTQPGWAERFKGSEDDKGYYVVYDDGYASWSPTKAFESGYTKLRSEKTDFALGGKIYWEDLAKQFATVWWKVAEVGGTLQHGDLDSAETCFSVVLEKHGGQCFHADTPMDAWEKAKAWLMSPDRSRPSKGAFDIDRVMAGEEEQPTLEDWMNGWEAARESGQSHISREEAEERYYQTYGTDGRPNGEG